jgi:beta-lactamase class D
MRLLFSILCLSFLSLTACRESRIHEHEDWAKAFTARGITKGCFILRDNNHEAIHYYNKERCLERFSPASTFKIFNSLVALETSVAPDEQYTIVWDSIDRGMPDWNRDLNMREAIKVSAVPYYQELARRIGLARMQLYLDTMNYGNANIGGKIDEFWLNDSLQISADEQVGFVKRLYFAELPASERSQRIVKSMILQEETPAYKLYYKTGWAMRTGKNLFWVVGFIERIQHVKEDAKSMNKSDIRMYPYFFALNFAPPAGDTTTNWPAVRVDILKDLLKDFGAITAVQ